jgi:SNF2 family DNA or RNA helicase
MGLGKTAQTLAHIEVERATGRLDRPALVVVPTSLVANWMAEAAKFTPDLRLVLWHGLDRHERREEIGGADLVVTTYTLLARDIEIMRRLEWHLVVLDESQAIKNPEAKWSRAVRQLNARHQLCLSGTPVENRSVYGLQATPEPVASGARQYHLLQSIWARSGRNLHF